MANAGSGKSGRTSKPRKSAAKPKRSAATEVARLAAEKEASDDKVFALTHRVATLEGRERDLNELIIGHRERVAALQAERDSLGTELESERQDLATLRERERHLSDQLAQVRERTAALEAEREAIGRQLADEQQKSSRFEQRADEVDEQLSGARDHIAALEASRDQLNDEVETANRRSAELRAREAELTGQIGAPTDRIAALGGELEEERRRVADLERTNSELSSELSGHSERIAGLSGELEDERRRAAELKRQNSELSAQLSGRLERIAELEAGREDLRAELDVARREIAALLERERDVQNRTVILHEQVARLEAEGEMVNRALREERAAHSALQQQEATLRPELENARERLAAIETQHGEVWEAAERRERELQAKMGAAQEQVGRLKTQRDSLERALAEEQRDQPADEKLEAELAGTRLRITALETERDRAAANLEGERKSLAQLQEREAELKEEVAQVQEREGELQEALAEARERETDLQGTIAGIREQVGDLESERTSLLDERNVLESERDRLQSRLEQLESSRTYRMMRFTWRVRKRIRHPFQRRPRPALTQARKPAKRKKPAELEKPAAAEPATPAPAAAPQATPKVKPIPTPAMRKPAKTAEPAAETKAEQTPEPAPEPATEPEAAPEPTPAPTPAAPVVTEEDLERERWLAKTQAPPTDVRRLRVAGVLDEMSAACFGPDCELLRIDSEGWQEALEAHEPHLLLVESTWQGNNGSWQYMVASYTHPDYIGLPNLRALITWCRERGIPTVFWNKEDPVHFERFKEAAALFDYIFTSDANCIDRYAALERDVSGPIESLQFAAQPRVHNPIGAPVDRSASPVFAGAYYRDRHIDRQKSLQMLLDAAMPFGLEIYDRRFGHEDKAFGFPERFADRVKGGLPYDEMIEAYKEHRVFLNVNSVHDSPTMFSRRVFELLACGTAVVSTESIGVERTLGDVVSIVEKPGDATKALEKLQDEDYWRELSQRGRRRVIGEHTYRHRLAEIGTALGFNVTAYPDEEVAALALVDDVDQARRFRAVVASISAQETRPAELLIGSHTSVAGDLQELQSNGSEIRVRVIQQDAEATRSQRYRELAALAASPWLAILHPAHTYGEHHLTDLVLTTRFVDADVIGNASFETSEGSGAVDRSLEHRFVDSIHPHSALVNRELIAKRGWPDDVSRTGKSLSDWFREGVRIYSADAGNFQADAVLGLPGRAHAAGSERGPEG